MNELVTISGVRGYIDENGVAQLNLEDVARGLGFTTVATSGNECVRWKTVRKYLDDLGVATSCNDDIPDFIPENIFYRLAMKAKNETAEVFQSKVADEILPAIRKTGSYLLPAMTPAQLIAAVAQQAAEQEQQLKRLATTAEQQGQQIATIKDTIITRDENWRKWVNDRLNAVAIARGGNYQEVRKESYELLESRGACLLAVRVNHLKSRLQNAGGTKPAIEKACKLDVIENDVRLREIYGAIVRELSIKYTA